MRVSLKSDLQNIYRELPWSLRFGNALQSMANYRIVDFDWAYPEHILKANIPSKLPYEDSSAVFMRPTPSREGVQLWSVRDQHEIVREIEYNLPVASNVACVNAEVENRRKTTEMELSFRCTHNQGLLTPICHSHFGRNGACQVFVLRSEFNHRLVRVNGINETEWDIYDGILDVSNI